MNLLYSTPLLFFAFVGLLYLQQCPTVSSVPSLRAYRRFFSQAGKKDGPNDDNGKEEGEEGSQNGTDSRAKQSESESSSSLPSFMRLLSLNGRRKSGTKLEQNDNGTRGNESVSGRSEQNANAAASPQMPRRTDSRGTNVEQSRNVSGNNSPLFERTPPADDFNARSSRRTQSRSNNQQSFYESPKKKGKTASPAEPSSTGGRRTDSDSENIGGTSKGQSGGMNRRRAEKAPLSPATGGHRTDSDSDISMRGRRSGGSISRRETLPKSRPNAPAVPSSSAAADERRTERRSESTRELAGKALMSSIDAGIYSAKVAKKMAVPTLKCLYENMEMPDREKLAQYAKTAGNAALMAKRVVTVAGQRFLPPLGRGTLRYALPTLGTMLVHSLPIMTELTQATYKNAVKLGPYAGRIRKRTWRASKAYLRPAYNHLLLPTMKNGAKKVLEWQDWAESNSEAEDNHERSTEAVETAQNVGTSSGIGRTESETAWKVRLDESETESEGGGKSGKKVAKRGNRSRSGTAQTPAMPKSESESEGGKGKQKMKKKQAEHGDIFDQLQREEEQHSDW